jgi:arsenate reductase
LKYFPIDKIINTKGTTYKSLTDGEKNSITDQNDAISLMINKPSLIKRPILDFGKGKLLLGYDEAALSKYL